MKIVYLVLILFSVNAIAGSDRENALLAEYKSKANKLLIDHFGETNIGNLAYVETEFREIPTSDSSLIYKVLTFIDVSTEKVEKLDFEGMNSIQARLIKLKAKMSGEEPTSYVYKAYKVVLDSPNPGNKVSELTYNKSWSLK